MHRPARLLAVAFVSLLAATFLPMSRASAAAPWIYRGLTLPRHDVALGFGLGYGHRNVDAPADEDGWGLNLELRAGIAHGFELGFRMGFRLDDGGQATQADNYGRPFDTETYGTNNDRVANPELRFRWSLARSYAAELGLELRAYLPIESNSRFGMMFGLPIALRAGPIRFDTGLYVPVIFYDPTLTVCQRAAAHLDPGGLRLLARSDPRPPRGESARPHRLPTRLRPGLADQPRRRHPHLVPVRRHEPARCRPHLRHRHRARSQIRIAGRRYFRFQ